MATRPPAHEPMAVSLQACRGEQGPGRPQVGGLCAPRGGLPPQMSPATAPGEWTPRSDRLAAPQTLLFELLKQGQAGDAGPREHDVVLAGCVPAQAPGHHAVQLGLILQCVQPIWVPAFLQVDVNL